jgi:hypothetical protein
MGNSVGAYQRIPVRHQLGASLSKERHLFLFGSSKPHLELVSMMLDVFGEHEVGQNEAAYL